MKLYQIRIEGQLDGRWLRQFDGLNVSYLPEGETLISGEMDQAALHGVLARIRDLGVELISVQRQAAQMGRACTALSSTGRARMETEKC